MKYLFDVNVLLALAHQNHADHSKAGLWLQSVVPVAREFMTCSMTELGFVRVSIQAGLEPDIASAQQTLEALKQSSHIPFVLVPDALGAARLPRYVKASAQLTDGHLLELAKQIGARLATLDKGIPGALVVG